MSSQFYRDLLNGAKSDLSNYKRRKRELESILRSYSQFDTFASDLNLQCGNASASSYSGIRISGGSNDVYSVFEVNDGGSGDNNLSSSRSYVNLEIQRVQNKISELESSVRLYQTSLAREEQIERDEFLQKVASALSGK